MVLLRLRSSLLLVLLVAGCGDDDSAVSSEGPMDERSTSSTTPAEGAPAGGELPFGLQRCPADRTLASAPEEWYRDEPVYVENEMPVEAVRAWATGQPDFEDIWIDRAHDGWISVAFSAGAEERHAELEREFPGVGVVAVPVEWTEAELVQLRDEAFGAMEDADFQPGGSHGVHTGLVEVWVGELTEEHLAPLAPFAGPRLCVTGVESVDVVRPGPQPEAGEGWRLLGTDRTGDSYRTGVAITDEQYAGLWQQAGLDGDPPDVDFDDEVVIWFGAVYGSGCEIRMDDVVFDQERRIVHGDFVIPGVHQGCNDDDPPAGVPEERTTVTEDLRSPGVTIPG